METRLTEFLKKLAMTQGHSTYAPASNTDLALQDFQEEIGEIQQLAGTGRLKIIGEPHRESRTGKRYVDRIRIELTPEGKAFLGEEGNRQSRPEPPSVTEGLAKVREEFDANVLQPLRFDSRVQGMNAYQTWKNNLLSFLEQHLPQEVSRFRELSAESKKSGEPQKENAYNSFMRNEGKAWLNFLNRISVSTPAVIDNIRVFISYGREDVVSAIRLYDDLTAKEIDVWLDVKSLLPGQNWKTTIRRQIRERRYFIALLSRNSVTKRGFVQKELKEALAVLEEYPASSVFIIPARLDECLPSDDALRDLHWVNMFENWAMGVESILKVMKDHPITDH